MNDEDPMTNDTETNNDKTLDEPVKLSSPIDIDNHMKRKPKYL